MNIVRDYKIDFLRCLGTLLVILAHVNPPEEINLMRSFDVCLLVLISGFCYKNNEKYNKYCFKRIKRLCVPAWICATMALILCGILCLITQHKFIYSTQQIVETYLFLDGGMGLLWIVRIYMLMALVAPIIEKIVRSIKKEIVFLGLVALTLMINEGVYQWLYGKNDVLDFFYKNYVMSIIAYGCVYGIGMRIKKNGRALVQYLIVFAALLLIVFTALFIRGGGYHPTDYKYPPQSIYVIFGCALSLLCWWLISLLKNFKSWRCVVWLSSKSFDVYLIHGLLIYILSWGADYLKGIPIINEWWGKYFLVLIGAILMTLVLEKTKKIIVVFIQKRKERKKEKES